MANKIGSSCVVFLGLLVLVLGESSNGHCIWYGQCGIDSNTNIPFNCEYTGLAKALEKENVEILQELCPDLVSSTGVTKTCCDGNQLKSFRDNMSLTKTLLGNCPGCWSNFRKYVCQMVCSPDQSTFLYVQKIGEAVDAGKPILEVQYFVTESFTERLFTSCANVYSDLMSMNAMDILCGPWGSKECTGQRLLTYLGDNSNNLTPFLINMTYVSTDSVMMHDQVFHPVNAPTTPCDEPVNVGESACSCSDCPAAC